MKQGKYTLSESGLKAISLLQPLDPSLHGVNFRTTNYDDALAESRLIIAWLDAKHRTLFERHKPEYILWFADGTIIAWYDYIDGRWVIPGHTHGLHASLYRIRTYILGLRNGMEACVKLWSIEPPDDDTEEI